MRIFRYLFFPILFFGLQASAIAQFAVIEGYITDTTNQAIPYVNISVEGTSRGTQSTDKGFYQLRVPAEVEITVIFSHTNFKPTKKSLTLEKKQRQNLSVRLLPEVKLLEEVEVNSALDQTRDQAGSLTLDGEDIKKVPTAFMDFNQQLVTGGLGVTSNNELSSSYRVRGGNFDENLVYVNDIQVYRPFLVRSGQQEGLSFVNPDMVDHVNFSAGGWQSKYGDKLSSNLDITYKTPKEFSAVAVLSLLNNSLELEGSTKNNRISYMIGFRNKNSEYLLNTLDTQGEYLPRYIDVQSFVNFKLGKKGDENRTTLSVLSSFAQNRYKTAPQTRTTEFGTLNSAMKFTVAFDGTEQLNYDTFQGGLKLQHHFSDNFTTKVITSGMTTKEREYIDLESFYRISDVQTDLSSGEEKETVLGIGTEYAYARNQLNAYILTSEIRNEWQITDQLISEFGVRYDHENIDDKINEYAFIDSAGYVTEYKDVINAKNQVKSDRLSAYYQHSHFWDKHQLIYGLRMNYWNYSNETVWSPRVQYSFKPEWEKDIVWRASTGIYHQPAFYREMRYPDGSLNENIKAQSSAHAILGFDYNFTQWGRPFKLIVESYYKYLWNLIPYEVDNVRLKYQGENNAIGHILGTDIRVSGEFIPGAESWLGLSILTAREKIEGVDKGWVRRPSDQRITFNMFFQDHLPNNPTIRMYLRAMYGSGLPYGIPGDIENRNAYSANTDYQRVDIGFSKIFEFKESDAFMESIWVGVEVLNLLGSNNNLSFTWVDTIDGFQVAVPNSLSQRFYNLKMILRY
ncbi:TonB-dependent receptor [Sediminitomix flava]|uniref:TonB-dependent receptor-like protein n=1 Tax=Sediminitomix flava TaxID=379075 RepID=A0A315ZCF6_SEDFL|nr:TonB-dependent receptor [Sediminitomix flava]PWJ42799.1 TonB-dependent receptor-like protein [Sediminitomix flava]